MWIYLFLMTQQNGTMVSDILMTTASDDDSMLTLGLLTLLIDGLMLTLLRWVNIVMLSLYIGTTSFPRLSFVQPSVPRLDTNTEHSIEIGMFPDHSIDIYLPQP